MYLTARAFAQHLVEHIPTQDLIDMLGAVQIALHRFGSRFVAWVENADVDNDIHAFGRFLREHNKLSVKQVKTITSLVKALKNDYKKEFLVAGASLNQISDVLQSRFGEVRVNERSDDEIALEVNGEGWIYKRSLGGDLGKLLH